MNNGNNAGAGGYRSLYYPAASTGSGESLRFIGGIITYSTAGGPNTAACMDFEGGASITINFYGTSFDQCPWTINNNGFEFITCTGCHFENPQGALTANGVASGTPIDFITFGSSCTVLCHVNLIGSDLLDDYAATTRTELIYLQNSAYLTVSGGHYQAAANIAAIVGGSGNLGDWGATWNNATNFQGASVVGTVCFNLGCFTTGLGVVTQVYNGSFFVNSTTMLVSALPSAATYPGGQIQVSDSTAIAAEGQTCAGGSSHAALAIALGGVWKCF